MERVEEPIVVGVKFKGDDCFKSAWAGFDDFGLINVIIGKNNTGKSRLLSLVKLICDADLLSKQRSIRVEWKVGVNIGARMLNACGMNHHVRYEDGSAIDIISNEIGVTSIENGARKSSMNFGTSFMGMQPFVDNWNSVNRAFEHYLPDNFRHPWHGRKCLRLLADRDIRPEKDIRRVRLDGNGEGATILIWKFLYSSDKGYPEEIVRKNLLGALNMIFSGDGFFSRIEVKTHDTTIDAEGKSEWEVFLEEEKKGLVALSESGSGLKTVILVLLYLMATPFVPEIKGHKYVYVFEELENNLHPALLRRLFAYLAAFEIMNDAPIFITTHSNVALDVFGPRDDSRIVLVTHDGTSGTTQSVKAHFDRYNVISELGSKPSDLLQANGIVWVEGPSDRIYLNRWIELLSKGKLQEGIHYQCAFYGGSLLAHVEVAEREKAEREFVNLLRINSNMGLVLDSDRTTASGKGNQLKDRAERINGQLKEFPHGFKWITECKEIEHYLPGEAIGEALGIACPDPDKYERFFPSESKKKQVPNFVVDRLGRKTFDKVEMAHAIAPRITLAQLEARWDLVTKVKELIGYIEKWNR